VGSTFAIPCHGLALISTLLAGLLNRLVRRTGRGGQHPAGPSAQVTEVDPVGLDGGDQQLDQVHGRLDGRRLGGGTLAHVVRDGALRPRRHDGMARNADPRTTTIYNRRREILNRHAAYVVVAS
jgi:hypothetical protein